MILFVLLSVLPEPAALESKMTVLGSYSTYCQVVTTVFIILFGVNFSAYYLILTKKFKQAFKLEEVRYYFGIILASVILIAVNTRHMFSGFAEAFQQSAFQVGSIITTTGYSITDFNQWPALSKTILVLLNVCWCLCRKYRRRYQGFPCCSSAVRHARKEFQLYLHPNAVKLKMDNKAVSHETLRSTNIFLSVYLLIFCGSILIVSLDNFDLITNFTAVAATLNNIGPGLEVAGPMGNFSSFSYLSKSVMIFDMLAGRLEIFPLLLLFFKDTWKKF